MNVPQACLLTDTLIMVRLWRISTISLVWLQEWLLVWPQACSKAVREVLKTLICSNTDILKDILRTMLRRLRRRVLEERTQTEEAKEIGMTVIEVKEIV
jgi:hypothetical protein